MVELLIVVVVIAILAAITIVAYNGIQNRAKVSAAQAAAKQAFTKIQTIAVSNADTYPANLAAAGLTNSDGTSYQYRVDNTASPKTFCLTTTSNNVSYYVSNVTSAPTMGACPGHGVDGGGVLVNLLANPSFESAQSIRNSGYNFELSRVSQTMHGAWALQHRVINAGTSYIYLPQISGAPGQMFSARATAKVTAGGTRSLYLALVFRLSDGTASQVDGANTLIPFGNSAVLSVTGTAPPNTIAFEVQLRTASASAGDVYAWDAVMIVGGPPPSFYADGSTPSWAWNGTPNDSTSSGPPL